MPEGFLNIEIENDPVALREAVYEQIKAQFPEWNPSKAILDKWIIDGCALIGADLGDIAGFVPEEILRQFGETIFKVPTLKAEPAIATVTIFMTDALGHPTIPAGTQMMLTMPSGNKAAFRTKAAVEVPVGKSEVKGVLIEAVEAGSEENQLVGNPQMLDSVSYIKEVKQTSANTSGGRDAETPSEYLDRLTTKLELLSTAPILPEDYAKLARALGSFRAVGIDGYEPIAETENNERMVAVAAVDEEGEGWTAPKKEEFKAEAEASREINFVVNPMDPTYNEMSSEVEVSCLPGFAKANVKQLVEEALDQYFSPKNWGNTASEPRLWRQNLIVRKTEVIALVNNVAGVDFIVGDVKLAKAAEPLEAKDVNLIGKAALTKPKVGGIKVTAV